MRNGLPCGIAVLLTTATLALTGCQGAVQGAGSAGAADAPVVVARSDEGQPAKLTLSERAQERLGIQTADVLPTPGQQSVTIPYAAVVYDSDGAAWTFTQVSPRTYLRAPITIQGIAGDQVALTAGPAAGTPVVTVGAAELVGAESGISGEE
jgi:hypothetical protein